MFAASASMSAPSGSAIRVLLVEDCRLVRTGLRSILNNAITIKIVGEVETGELAIAQAQKERPDVVLIDLGLPGMSGIETMMQLKRLQLADKFVVLTSCEEKSDVLSAIKAGAQAYCVKNIEAQRLLEVITSVHEGAAWFDPAIAKMALGAISEPAIGEQVGTSSGPLRDTPLLSGSECNSLSFDRDAEHNYCFSERELSILRYIVAGKSNGDIAKELYISVHTAKFYVSNLLEKLGVSDRVQAAVKAVKEGLVE